MSDAFESGHMTGDGNVRHRDKRVSRAMAALLAAPALFCWVLAVFLGFANASSSQPVPQLALPFVLAGIAAMGLLFAVLSVTFAVLRSVVTDSHVNVKYGLWGPEIELSSIRACKVVDYEWTQFGGWGIRRGVGGAWAYVQGPGEVVEIEYLDGDTVCKVQVGARDARRLSLEINRARENVTRLRVQADAHAEGEDEAELELIASEEAHRAEKALTTTSRKEPP